MDQNTAVPGGEATGGDEAVGGAHPGGGGAPERRVTVVLFDGFELLDVFGPVELFHLAPGVSVDYVGPERGAVRSSQGAEVVAQRSYDECDLADVLLVPGGRGTRTLVADADFLGWLSRTGEASTLVTSVCTGSALLAAAGLLDGYRATTNKAAYAWATGYGDGRVDWAPVARWVHDRDRWTSSGVSAGMDMAAALLADLCGPEAAAHAADLAELEVHPDAGWDPFAARYGLGPAPE